MDKQQIYDTITESLRTECCADLETFRPEHYLIEDLGLDSMSALNLAVDLENRFQITLDEELLDGPVETIQDLVDEVANRVLKH